MIGNGKREVGRPTQPVVLGDEATVYQEIPPEQAPETRSHQDTPLHRTKTPYFAGTFIGAFGDNGDSMLPSSSCFTWNPVAANGEFRPAPTSAKLGCADFRSDNPGSPSDNAHHARPLYIRPLLAMSSDDQGIAALTPPADHHSGAGSPIDYSSPQYYQSPAAEPARRPSNGRSKYKPAAYLHFASPRHIAVAAHGI